MQARAAIASANADNEPAHMQGFVPPPALLLATAKRLGTAAAYHVHTDQGWQATSWQRYGEQVQDAARALLALGVQHGDGVAILSFNGPAWGILAMAAMAIGAKPVGIYWTSSSADIAHILNHSKAPVLMVDKAERLAAVQACITPLPHLRHLITLDELPPSAGLPPPLTWQAFLALSHATHDPMLQRRMAALRHDDIGTLIYTSGTTGPAKAVMLSQGNLWWMGRCMTSLFEADERDRLLSYLPLAHVAEQMGTLHNQVHAGFSIYYARSIEALQQHLTEVRPTVFFGVPRVWEKIQAGIEARMAEARGPKAGLLRWAMDTSERWHEREQSAQRIGPWLHLQHRLAHKLVHSKVHRALGLDAARLLSSGAAPIAAERLRFFAGLDMPVREVYGQSEVCGPSTLSLRGSTRWGSVGRPLPGTRVRMAEDGELEVHGPHLFQGYLGDAAATAASFTADGWLRTGDLGHVDEDGHVRITGRKKDLIITSGGKNIAPAHIESLLMASSLIEHAVVAGDGRHYLLALLTLNPLGVQTWARTMGLDAGTEGLEAIGLDPRLQQALQAEIDHVNSQLARVAQVRRFHILATPFSVEGGDLTPTLKVRRAVVLKKHQSLLDRLYSEQAEPGKS